MLLVCGCGEQTKKSAVFSERTARGALERLIKRQLDFDLAEIEH